MLVSDKADPFAQFAKAASVAADSFELFENRLRPLAFAPAEGCAVLAHQKLRLCCFDGAVRGWPSTCVGCGSRKGFNPHRMPQCLDLHVDRQAVADSNPVGPTIVSPTKGYNSSQAFSKEIRGRLHGVIRSLDSNGAGHKSRRPSR
jgi:hypothetical protein